MIRNIWPKGRTAVQHIILSTLTPLNMNTHSVLIVKKYVAKYFATY